MKRIKVTIGSIEPGLLMHRYPLVPIEGIEKMSMEEQADYAAYRIPETRELYIPGTAIQRALVGGAAFSKGKGRASLQKIVAACVFISPEYCGLGTTDYIIDSRRVVISATKGSIVRHRPRLAAWQTSFFIDYDEILMKEDQVRRVVDDTGSRVGLLEFNPVHKGPFGRFRVLHWTPQKNVD